jgi:hypothetical protein
MDPLLQSIAGQISPRTITQMSSALGIEDQQTQAAISLALPVLLGTLQRNAADEDGATALTNALERDHDGSILQDVRGNITRQEVMDDGNAIMGHVLGQKAPGIERSIGKSTGIDPQTVAMLITMLLPIVMGELGKRRQEANLSPTDVSTLLQQERETAKSNQPELSQLLDLDGDGDISNEVVTLGTTLLQGFLKK